jgi:hypothetical protein
MSWLEDFSDGQAVWQRLMSAPSFGVFLDQARDLSDYERDKVILFHVIREKQAAGEWTEWKREDL